MHGGAQEGLERNKVDVALEMNLGDSTQFVDDTQDAGYECVPLLMEQIAVWYEKGNKKLCDAPKIDLETFKDVPILTTSGKTFDYILA